MNEQDRADALGALVDGASPLPDMPDEDAAFARQLIALAGQTRADGAFAADLETRLRAAGSPVDRVSRQPENRLARRSFYRIGLLAALLALTFAVLALPEVRDRLFQGAVTEEVLSPTITVGSLPTAQPADPVPDAVLVSAPIRGGFRIMGELLNYDRFYLGLMETTFAAYVDLMWSAGNDPVQS